MSEICVGPWAGVDNQGNLQARAPQEEDWPYLGEPHLGQGLKLDPTVGMWVKPGNHLMVHRPEWFTSALGRQDIAAGKWVITSDIPDLIIPNPSQARMWADLELKFRVMINVENSADGTGGTVAAAAAKTWANNDPEPPWNIGENEDTTTGGSAVTSPPKSFQWTYCWDIDASGWVEPGGQRVVHTAMRILNSSRSKGVIQVKLAQWRPKGQAFVPYPEQSNQTLYPPDPAGP